MSDGNINIALKANIRKHWNFSIAAIFVDKLSAFLALQHIEVVRSTVIALDELDDIKLG